MKTPKIIALATTVASLLSANHAPAALTSATGSLDLNGLTLTAGGDTIVWSPWSLNSLSSVANSDGATQVSPPSSGPVSTIASASVTYASASTSASIPGLPTDLTTLYGAVTGTASIPSGVNAAASVGNDGNNSSWVNQFSISGPPGSVDVTVTALLSSSLRSFADSMGTVLENDTIFNLNIDGSSVLYSYDTLPAGPNQSLSSSLSPNLISAPIPLSTGVSHTLLISIDTEQQISGISTVPEPTPLIAPVLALLLSLVPWRRKAA